MYKDKEKEKYCKSQGKALFKFKHDVHQKLIKSKEVSNTLHSYQWNINDKYEQQKWSSIFQKMIESQAFKLVLNRTFQPQILKQISHVHYISLVKLSLTQNYIKNIQPLSLINFQLLQELNLNCNLITQINCMNKASFSLNSINIRSNDINRISIPLTKSKIDPKQLKLLNLQNFTNQYVINQDLSFIAKINTQKVKQICVRSQKVIRQKKVQKMLKLKFPQIYISCHD